MPEDQLRGAIEAIRSRIQAELDAQLTAISSQQAEALATARRTAEAEAEQRWASKVEAVRAEWNSRLEAEVAATRGEAERRMVAESMRLRVEAEQAAAESTARLREELEQALASERQRAQAQIDAERQRAERELEQERQRLRSAGQAAQQAQSAAAVTEARASERQSQLAAIERLLVSVRAISSTRSLSDTLSALIKAAAAEAPRGVLFIVNGNELQAWKAEGFGASLTPGQRIPAREGMLGEALRRIQPVSSASGGGGGAAPAFASLPPDRAALAVPVIVGGQPVAVLYADDRSTTEPEAPAAWPEAIQILARHASACLAHLTAVRTTQVLRGVPMHLETASSDDENGARRYARLLVSEIKLYNETAVQLGRQKRDLLNRLRPEIERARRLYEERIPPTVGGRAAYFQQELVQTLAEGDPALLGG